MHAQNYVIMPHRERTITPRLPLAWPTLAGHTVAYVK
jgi:hypothetical protein